MLTEEPLTGKLQGVEKELRSVIESLSLAVMAQPMETADLSQMLA